MERYRHMVQYYETDKMGITHHSNYVRWMEEARIDFLRQLGWDYAKLEQAGVFSPVTAIECKYRASTTFPEEIQIEVRVAAFKSAILKLEYRMTNQADQVVLEARSEHCFLDPDGKLIRLSSKCPELAQALAALSEA